MEDEAEYVRILAGRIENDDLREKYLLYLMEILETLDADPILDYRDIPRELPYNANLSLYKPSIHIGHRKLFLTELRFFCRFVEPPRQRPGANASGVFDRDVVEPSREQVILYTGASPWTHGGLLMKLFPSLKFILVDPVPVNAKGVNVRPLLVSKRAEPPYAVAKRHLEMIRDSKQKVFSFECYFGNNFARAVKDVFPEIYFVSDIRTRTGSGKYPDSVDILWNMAQQMNWMFVFQPKLSMLKFRHPFYEDREEFKKVCNRAPYKADYDLALRNGADFRGNYDSQELVYFAGDIDVQPWPGPSSTESRLIVAQPFKLVSHGFLREWEDRYFYYTSIARPHGHYFNPNADISICFCNCNDCALENYIWEQYRANYDDRQSVREMVLLLGRYVNASVQGIPLHAHCYSYAELVQNAKLHNGVVARSQKK